MLALLSTAFWVQTTDTVPASLQIRINSHPPFLTSAAPQASPQFVPVTLSLPPIPPLGPFPPGPPDTPTPPLLRPPSVCRSTCEVFVPYLTYRTVRLWFSLVCRGFSGWACHVRVPGLLAISQPVIRPLTPSTSIYLDPAAWRVRERDCSEREGARHLSVATPTEYTHYPYTYARIPYTQTQPRTYWYWILPYLTLRYSSTRPQACRPRPSVPRHCSAAFPLRVGVRG